jgi:Universal stress protein family
VEIIGYARKQNIDLIVIATHGRTGLAHVLVGSVAETVVRTAPCPVLTVRPGFVRRHDDCLVHHAQRVRSGLDERHRAIVDEQHPRMAFSGLRQFRGVAAQVFFAVLEHGVEALQELRRCDAQTFSAAA